jgi:hypothetical protein
MWQPSDFYIARATYPVQMAGYVYKGLGLHIARQTLIHRLPVWHLTHLNTGHRVAEIRGLVAEAFPIATAIAECGDWDFLSLTGWKDQDPELANKVLKIIDGSKGRAKRDAGRMSRTHNHEVARAVLKTRS